MGLCLLTARLEQAAAIMSECSPTKAFGQLVGVSGISTEVTGLSNWISVGDRLLLTVRLGNDMAGEVTGFRGERASVMAYAPLVGLGLGSPASMEPRWNDWSFALKPTRLAVSDSWLGRIIDSNAAALDGKGGLPKGTTYREVHARAPEATLRARLGRRLDLGVKVLNIFTPVRHGQRLGLFAGSGVGKSTLLAMLARYAECDVAVVALVGERGREVREFVEDELGADALARSVVIVATSDSPALMRRQAAYTALTVAEHFRDNGKNVLFLMDSVTRFCSALREIALSTGEPPASRGFPPSVFAELPRMLERAGPGLDRSSGQMTAVFTILVEGDDHNEPVADSVRGILDGHIKLDRRIAESGRYPAVDILGSVSRVTSSILNDEERSLANRARAILSLWTEVGEMVRLGAYRTGTDAAIDEAAILIPLITKFLSQSKNMCSDAGDGFSGLKAILENPSGTQHHS